MSFRCATPVISRNDLKRGEPGVVAHAHRPKAETHTKKCRVERLAIPSDEESDADVPELVDSSEDERGQSSSGDESIDRMSRAARRSLREEANSLYHLLTHKPNNPYCEACRRENMKEQRKYVGSYHNTTVRWGQLVTGDHITSTKDNMFGIDWSKYMLVIMDAFSGFEAAYPMADKGVASTMEAIRHFKSDRKIERFYSDRSGEIERALRDLEMFPKQSQPVVPHNNAVAERLVQDVLDGTRTALVHAGLPPMLLGVCMQTLLYG